MTILEGKRVYLSGPIEHGKGPNWREEPKKILTNRFKLELFDPFADPKQQWTADLLAARRDKNYSKMSEIAHRFVKKDLILVQKTDFLIANLPYKVPTTGTVHEIINANNNKCPVLLVCEQGKEFIPLWFYGFIPTQVMFNSWDEVYAYLDEINDRKHIDNNRWSFVYGLV